MKFSVITPSFNSSHYIEKAIVSVLHQDYKNWEHIIVDGGSTDNTFDVLKKYPYLNWISEPDEGIYDAMNKGMKMSAGDILYFMGADDILYSSDVFKKIVNVFADGYDVVYGDVVSEHFGGRRGGHFRLPDLMIRNMCHQSIFFHKNVFEKVGAFDTRYKLYADWDHNLRWFLCPDLKSYYIDKVICEYGDGGVSSAGRDELFVKDMKRKVLEYGQYSINKGVRKKIAKNLLKDSWRDKDLLNTAAAITQLFKIYWR